MAKSKAKPNTSIKSPSKKKPATAAADWRSETLARMRELILAADPEMAEERKWKKPSNAMAGIPVWSHHGIVCTGETYQQVVKLTFAQGAKIPDPAQLFNASLEGGTRRAIDIHEGEQVNAAAFKALIKVAVAHNSLPQGSTKTKPQPKAKPKPIKLLSGGNPQIAMADGDAPVQAYLAAIPGWKREIGQRLDALIMRLVPKAKKAVKWNSPFYGIDGQGWFVSFHVFAKYVKLTFFKGTSLRSPPAGGTSQEARWIDIHEDDLNEPQLTKWIKQAAAIPGWLA